MTTQLETLAITNIEELIDPLISYQSIEDELSAQIACNSIDSPEVISHVRTVSPVGLREWAALINDMPHIRLKGTSRHDTMYPLSIEGVLRGHCRKIARAIYSGKDIQAEAAQARTNAAEVVDPLEFSLDKLPLIAQHDGYAIDILAAVIPDFHRLPEDQRIPLANIMFAHRLNVFADEIELMQPPAKEDQPIQLPPAGSETTISLAPPFQHLVYELSSPQIHPRTLTMFAHFIEKYALHMPLKITADREYLSLESIIQELMQKIAEGIEAGEGLIERSQEGKERAEAFVAEQPIVSAIENRNIAEFTMSAVDSAKAQQLQTVLPNYLLIQWMRRQAHPEAGQILIV